MKTGIKTTYMSAADKMYHEACTALNVKPKALADFKAMYEDEDEAKAFHSLHRITRVVKARKNGHKFDWNNYDEGKYYPLWDMETYEDAPAGSSGFSLHAVVFDRTHTDVGARLSAGTLDDAREIATVMSEEYKDWIKG